MEDNRKRYEITCPHCGKIQYVCKSIAHEMGIYNLGRGSCLECKNIMRLQYDPKADTMEAIRWENNQVGKQSGGSRPGRRQ